jgi:hypothetical protein
VSFSFQPPISKSSQIIRPDPHLSRFRHSSRDRTPSSTVPSINPASLSSSMRGIRVPTKEYAFSGYSEQAAAIFVWWYIYCLHPCEHANHQWEQAMKPQRPDFLLMVTLAAAATPALGQAAEAVVSRGGTQSNASVPDLSGLWSHPYWPGFEPPPSGPGPVLNKSRQRQRLDPDGRPLPAANAPLVSRSSQFVGDYTNPILKPDAAAVVKRHGEISLGGVAYPTPSNQCFPAGVPYIFWNFGIQMLQQPEKVTILYFFDHEFRQVLMNQPHPAHVTPSWHGDSVGHYEGDTLVIDTVGVKIGPFAMIDMFGTPHTEALHVVERYRLIDSETAKERWNANENLRTPGSDDGVEVDPGYIGEALELQFTVEDEGVFTTPWSAIITYRRALDETIELVCAENTREYYAGKDTAVPLAEKPDF